MTPSDFNFSTPDNAATSLRMLAELVRSGKATCAAATFISAKDVLSVEFVIPKDKRP